MPIDASIISNGIQPLKAIDPTEIQARIFGLRNAQQQNQLGALEVQQKQKEMSDQATMQRIYQGAYGQAPSQQPGWQGPTQPGEPPAGSANGAPGLIKTSEGVTTLDPNYLTRTMAAAGVGDKIPSVLTNLTAYQEKAASLAKLRGEVAVQTRDALGSLGATVDAAGATPAALHMAALLAIHNGQVTPEQVQPYLDRVDADPSQVSAITREMQSASPKQTELNTAKETADARAAASATGAQRLQLETPKIEADTTHAQQQVAGTVPMTTEQKTQAAIAQARLSVEQARNAREQKTYDTTYGAGVTPDGKPIENPVARAIAEYRVPPPAARSLASPAGQALMNQVQAINPEFDATQFPNRNKTRQAFTTGTQGQQINAMNTALGHLDQLGSAIKGLDNGNVQVVNSATNFLRTQLGGADVTNFDTLKVALSGELASVLKRSGATDAEIRDVQSTISAKNSPAQLAGYVQTQIPILGSKLNALNYQYHQAMGEKDPFSALSPEAKTVLQKNGFDPANPQIGGGGAGISVTAPNGKVYTFKSQADADAFKAKAGIK